MKGKRSESVGLRLTSRMRKDIKKLAEFEESCESAVIRRILKKNLPRELNKVKLA